MNSIKGAAFTASVMQACQDSPVDILMYYDARIGTIFNALFDYYSFAPTCCYYVFYAWSKIAACGSQIAVSGADDPEIFVTAAKDAKGRVGILVSRYTEDNNVTAAKKVTVRLQGSDIAEATAHLTDKYHLYTEAPVKIKDGAIELKLEPSSFVYLSL